MAQESELVAYCGSYCVACEVYQGKVKDAALILRKVLDTNLCVQRVMARERFPDVQKVLTFLVERFGQCEGCRKGGGDPYCNIRKCCETEGLTFCIECDKVTCEELSL